MEVRTRLRSLYHNGSRKLSLASLARLLYGSSCLQRPDEEGQYAMSDGGCSMRGALPEPLYDLIAECIRQAHRQPVPARAGSIVGRSC
jgi:hypothetical protein